MRNSRRFVGATVLLLLLSLISAGAWFDRRSQPEAWVLGGVVLFVLLFLWAHQAWVHDQWERAAQRSSREGVGLLQERLRRRLWGGLGVGIAILAGAFNLLDFGWYRAGNETHAEDAMWKLQYAQACFMKQLRVRNEDARFAVSLQELSPLLPEGLRDGEDCGYRFIQMAAHNVSGDTDPRHGFGYCAVPLVYGVTGLRKYICRDNSIWILYRDDGSNLPETQWVWRDDRALLEAGWTPTEGYCAADVAASPP